MAKHPSPRAGAGYGNIYTPHAGSMIIQVQREAGLANRTIVLSPKQVALLRALWSPIGRVALALLLLTWLFFAVQSARVPLLTARVQELEHTTAKLDTLQVALSRLHRRYDQVRLLMSHAPAASGSSSRSASPTSTPPGGTSAPSAATGADAPR